MSQFIVNIDGSVEQDKIFICDRSLHRLGELYPVEDLHTIMRLNQNDEVNFKIYKYNNGEENPFWTQIDNIQVILVEGKGYFEIAAPVTTEECTYKQVTGISLGEAETSQTNITLQINTEEDIARDDYAETILYNPSNHEGSLLHRIFQSMPHYTIGHVDASVACIQRTFSCDGQTVYDFLQTVAEELECIFIFDNFKREINCYDLKDHCSRASCIQSSDYRNVENGVCRHCNSSDYVSYGYGKDTGIFLDHYNLTESVTLSGNKDSVKNCFKIEGADELITNLLNIRLMDGNYIWKFSSHQVSQMSLSLQKALQDRERLVSSYQGRYNSLWDSYTSSLEKKLYYESGLMPEEKENKTAAQSVFHEIFTKITFACKTTEHQTADSILRSVNRLAGMAAPKTYSVEMSLSGSSNSSITFSVHIYLKNAYEKDNVTLKDEYAATKTLPLKNVYGNIIYASTSTKENPVFTNDYFLYLKQQLELSLENSEASESIISFDPPVTSPSAPYNPLAYAQYDNEANPQKLPQTHYTMYCINRLQSFRDAYEACSQIVAKLNSGIVSDADKIINGEDGAPKYSNGNTSKILKYINSSGGTSNIYEDLLWKYYKYIACIDARMAYLKSKVSGLKQQIETYGAQIQEIKNLCSMENFLKNYQNGAYGNGLWNELCSFKREDTYKNDNYAGDGYDNATVTENVEGLIKRAEEELADACEVHYSINTTIGNLLTMEEFKPLWDDFCIGNWLRIQIDGDIYRLRLISVSFDYTDVSHIDVEFSDVTKTNSAVADLKSIFQQAASISSNFNSVSRQAEKGYMTNQEFSIMKEAGLDVANTMITNADNQDFVINQYGLTGRMWDDVKNAFDDEQLRIINNLLCFTSDGWKHTRLALGKIFYYNDEASQWEWAYGLNAEVLIANLIMSEMLKIYNKSGTYSITDKGFFINYKDNTIEINAMEPSVTMSKMVNGSRHIYLRYSPADGLIIDGTGRFSGFVLVGNESGNHIKLDPANPSMVIRKNGENIFDFNSDGLGFLKITTGIITGILKSADYVSGSRGMCINLENKSMEIYNDKSEELLSFNLGGNQLMRIGGWNISKDRIYSSTPQNPGTRHVELTADGNIHSYMSGTGNLMENYAARLLDGKYIFGLYDDTSHNFVENHGYIDISQAGFYAASKPAQEAGESRYLLKVDTIHDDVEITGHTDTPSLKLINHGSGDALFCENKYIGKHNNALHCKVFTGDGSSHHIAVFGEEDEHDYSGKRKRRMVFRSFDVKNDDFENGIDNEPCDCGVLGTSTFPWEAAFARDYVTTSDLKKKNVIGTLDKKKSLDFILALNPIRYTFKGSGTRVHMGFGAQHVAQTAKDLNMGDLALYEASVVKDDGSEGYYRENIGDENLSWCLKYNEFEAPAIAAIQSLHEMVTEQWKALEEKETIIREQSRKIDGLTQRLEKLEKLILN
ncbi:tail fiber domain-containing protein [bacterium D16-51]|nr:tail fiber domain-containing protein [bacterium D16-59]RKI61850.1 tail fiber domain-containing protein [bacterium D16-51]